MTASSAEMKQSSLELSACLAQMIQSNFMPMNDSELELPHQIIQRTFETAQK